MRRGSRVAAACGSTSVPARGRGVLPCASARGRSSPSCGSWPRPDTAGESARIPGMDALDFLRTRYAQFHRPMWDELTGALSERELRGRPHPRANTIVWLVWHIARVEDLGVNRFVVDGRQVMDRGDWATRMNIPRRDVGTGMTDAEVDTLSAAIDIGRSEERRVGTEGRRRGTEQ